MIALELRGLRKRFGGVVAVDGVDLEVEEGAICVLLGPSGCGKSTLLRLVAGLETPTEGEVRIGGRRVDGLEPRDRDVAMVFQSYALYPHMTVARNLGFPLRVRGVARVEIAERVRETARILRIEDLLDRRPRELSGGQRQRVAIGRALVRRPRVFLFDEPLSNLDATLRTAMREEIARLHRELGTTILHVTHDQVEAMTLGDAVAVLRAGRVEQIGTPEEIHDRPATRFVAGFVGSPPMSFVRGTVERGTFAAGGLSLSVETEVRGPAEIGIRPEHARLGGEDATGTVVWVENRGADRYAHVDVDGGRIVVRTAPGERPQEGDRVGLSLPRARVHVFGRSAGKAGPFTAPG